MLIVHLQYNNNTAVVRVAYEPKSETVYLAGDYVEIDEIGLQLLEISQNDQGCAIIIDAREYPYISFKNQVCLNDEPGLYVIHLEEQMRNQFAVAIDTNHEALQQLTNSPIEISLPVYFTLGFSYEQGEMQPAMIDDQDALAFFYTITPKPIEKYAGFIGIDFGTTNSCLAFLAMDFRKPVPEILIPDKFSTPEVSTLLYFEKRPQAGKVEGVQLVPNLDFIRQKGNYSALVRGIKRYLGADGENNIFTIPIKGRMEKFTTEQLVALFLDQLQGHFIKQQRHCFSKVVGCSRPCNFAVREKLALKNSFAQLKQPVPEGDLELDIDEASAAAIFYTMQDINKAGGLASYVELSGDDSIMRNLLIYDFGGGTIDIALVNIYATRHKMRFKVFGNTSIMDFGGDNVTLVLLKRIKAYFCWILIELRAVEDAYNQREPGLVSEDPDWYNDFCTLRDQQEILEAYIDNQTLTEAEQSQLATLIKRVISTNFSELKGLDREDALNWFYLLWDICENLKKIICKHEVVAGEKLRDEFVKFIQDMLARIGIGNSLEEFLRILDSKEISLEKDLYPDITLPLITSMRAMRLLCMKDQEQLFHNVDSIRLTGNSSRIPLVRQLIERELQTVGEDSDGNPIQFLTNAGDLIKNVDEDAKTSVSKGMAIAMAIRRGQTRLNLEIEDQKQYLTYEIGTRDSVQDIWFTVFERGIPLPASTSLNLGDLYNIEELLLYRRICGWHNVKETAGEPPLYPIGKFIFSPENVIVKLKKWSESDIVFHYDRRGQLTAQRLNWQYRFHWYRSSEKQNDPFSGIH